MSVTQLNVAGLPSTKGNLQEFNCICHLVKAVYNLVQEFHQRYGAWLVLSDNDTNLPEITQCIGGGLMQCGGYSNQACQMGIDA
ncbi:hypothetical protein AAFF_G00361480 [Aldrovandia affinis]|uniref:Uncharacterized protein n=1 Tax=Aldrovandia affinis TaxID=143900 RepID=A0AAD7SHU8_9TELE|nr:hypothetical protein AAFF_G00361480 [Aldrovandia affinis]